MFGNYRNYLFVNDSLRSEDDLVLDLLKYCTVDENVTLCVSLERIDYSCEELATMSMNVLDNIIFTNFSGNMNKLKKRLIEIHHLRRKPRTVIFKATSETISSILFIVSTIFSFVQFLPETSRSIIIINDSDCSSSLLKKLTDLFYTETRVFKNFENLKIELSNT